MKTTLTDRHRAESPDISVMICTRDRGQTLLQAIQSVLFDAPTDGSVELIVVDQGSGNEVEQALAPLLAADGRLRYLRETSVGLSAARNAGLRAARGMLIACTDDDCTVEPGWLATLTAAFNAHPEAGIVFGQVASAAYDPSQGYLPHFQTTEGALTRRKMLAGAGRWGMGANMALRRAAWEKIGPFDEVLGAGAPLKSAEDVDYALRALHCGIGVYHCPQARVIHYGFRPWAAASTLMKGAAFGIGAMYAKQGRAGSLFALLLLLSDLTGRTWDVLRNGARGRRPLGANMLIYQVKGFWHGLRLPLDRRKAPLHLLFQRP